jgi:ribokinase
LRGRHLGPWNGKRRALAAENAKPIAAAGRARGVDLAALKDKRVVVLPDLYVDAVVQLPAWQTMRKRMSGVVERGGGNIPVRPIELTLGGNAANLANALAALGARVQLLAHCDRMGMMLVREAAAETGLDVSLVRQTRGSTTIALECNGKNIMLSDAGPLAEMTAGDWTDADKDALRKADAVAVVNWGQTPQGTEILAAARTLMRPEAILYFDSGDPSNRKEGIGPLLEVVRNIRLDAWAMNDNEARQFSEQEDPVAGARHLAALLDVRIDLHTRRHAWSFGSELTEAAANSHPRVRTTGAGDHWNAGNLAGYLLGLPALHRLHLAHAVATCFVTAPQRRAPRPADLDLLMLPARQ